MSPFKATSVSLQKLLIYEPSRANLCEPPRAGTCEHVEAKTFEPSRAESHLFFPTSSLSPGLLGPRQIS